jgi:hypothetical protein
MAGEQSSGDRALLARTGPFPDTSFKFVPSLVVIGFESNQNLKKWIVLILQQWARKVLMPTIL